MAGAEFDQDDPFDPSGPSLAVARFTRDTGMVPVGRPDVDPPGQVSGLAHMADDKVMETFEELVAWLQFLDFEQAKIANEVMFAERKAKRAMADAVRERLPNVPSIAAAERDAEVSPQVRDAEDRLDEARARQRMVRSASESLDNARMVVNREVSLRIARMPAEARLGKHQT